MTDLFTHGYLRDFMDSRVHGAISDLQRMSEYEVLRRSVDDLARDLRDRVYIEPLIIRDEPIDGGVTEGTVC